MTQPINLNKARKAKARDEKKARAAENTIQFGLTKAERLFAAAKEQQAAERLAQLKFEDD
jgi:hypothetical protein